MSDDDMTIIYIIKHSDLYNRREHRLKLHIMINMRTALVILIYLLELSSEAIACVRSYCLFDVCKFSDNLNRVDTTSSRATFETVEGKIKS